MPFEELAAGFRDGSTTYSYTIHTVGRGGMKVETRHRGAIFDSFIFLPMPGITQMAVLWTIDEATRVAAAFLCLQHQVFRSQGPGSGKVAQALANWTPRLVDIDGDPVGYDF